MMDFKIEEDKILVIKKPKDVMEISKTIFSIYQTILKNKNIKIIYQTDSEIKIKFEYCEHNNSTFFIYFDNVLVSMDKNHRKNTTYNFKLHFNSHMIPKISIEFIPRSENQIQRIIEHSEKIIDFYATILHKKIPGKHIVENDIKIGYNIFLSLVQRLENKEIVLYSPDQKIWILNQLDLINFIKLQNLSFKVLDKVKHDEITKKYKSVKTNFLNFLSDIYLHEAFGIFEALRIPFKELKEKIELQKIKKVII